eukprot:5009468-Pyramimonas_sp.AAC.1
MPRILLAGKRRGRMRGGKFLDRRETDIMLCDANTHAGSGTSSAIGDEGFREQRGLSGSMLYGTLHHVQHVAAKSHLPTGPVHCARVKQKLIIHRDHRESSRGPRRARRRSR